MLQILQDGNEGFCIFGPGGPARGKADYCMVFVIFFPEPIGDFLFKFRQDRIGHDDKDLIRRRGEEKLVMMCFQGFADPVSRFDGRAADLLIQMIREQRIKLQAEQPALGEQGTMLLDDGKEMRHGVFFRGELSS